MKSIQFYSVFVSANVIVSLSWGFNPFSDQDLHAIEWQNTLGNLVDENFIVVKSADNEQYKCMLPVEKELKDGAGDTYTGPGAEELMEMFFSEKSCSYRIESYWTYELCHGQHIKQYHESKELSRVNPPIQSYILGYSESGKQQTEKAKGVPSVKNPAEFKFEVKIRKLDGVDLPFVEYNMTDGTLCDLTKKPRRTTLLYVCQPEGRGEIYEFKEISTCEYEMIILTAVLCSNPKFKPKDPPVSKISCEPLGDAPVKPSKLVKWETEDSRHLSPPQESQPLQNKITIGNIEIELQEATPPPKAIKPTKPPVKDSTLGETTDKQVLRSFLSGSTCFQGGDGWWKHELCYGKSVKQFHEDKNGRTEIFLGYWNEQKHMSWAVKKQGHVVKKSHVSHFYSDGDFCDLTGKNRNVEVKIKCIQNKSQPHSVSIFLMENKPCEYVLGVESALFCGVIDQANEYGLLDHINV